MKLDGSFNLDQEGSRKDVERAFGVLKLKFLVLSHPINFHHRDDIYYMVLATILLHNMMVEERIRNDESEDSSFYDIICDDPDDKDEDRNNNEMGDDSYDHSPVDRNDKSMMVHKRWEELYDHEGSKRLKDSMKRHLYSVKYSKDALANKHMWMDNQNPPSI